MGLVAYDENIIPTTFYQPPARPPADDGGFLSAFGSSFARENDIWALTRLAGREDFPADPNFDFDTAARGSRAFGYNPEPFLKARSAGEFNQIEARVAEEEELLRKTQSSGLGGFLGGLAGALVSPTTFLPGGAIYRGAKMASILKSTAAVGAAAAGATVVQEAVLQADQVTRTGEESAINVAFALALGGMIGGAVSAMSRKEIGKLASDMANDPGSTAIHIPGESPVLGDGSLSAAINPNPENLGLGQVAGIAPGLTNLGIMNRLNPVSRGLSNEFSGTARAMTASLDTGGLAVSGQANIGGDVASLAKQWDSLTFKALQKRAELMGGNFVARFMGARKFSEETAMALRRGGESDNPAVAAYASFLRTEVYGKILSEARRIGLKGFEDLDEEYVAKYVNRMARKGLIAKDHDQFTEVLQEHFSDAMKAQWSAAIERVDTFNARDIEAADDLVLDKDGVQRLRNDLEIQIAALPQQFAEEIRTLAEDIRGLRAEAQSAPRDEAKLLRAEAKFLEEQNKQMLQPFRVAEKKLKGRFARLGRTASGLQRKQQMALAQIEAIREAAEATRGRLVRQVQKIMNNLEKWDDARLDGEIEKLQAQIEKTFAVWQKGDERLAKMQEVPAEFRELEFSDVRPTEKISIEEARQLQRQEKLDDLLETLDIAKSLDREAKRAAIEKVAKTAVEEAEAVNFKRMKQEEKLNERIRDASPANAADEAAALRAKAESRRMKLLEDLASKNIRGATADTLDVSDAAKDLSLYVAGHYMGASHRMPFISVLEERGPELARMLNIDETKTWSNGRRFEEFLENDVEFLMRSYVRTMGPDLELFRKFGNVNPLAQNSPHLRKMVDEFDASRIAARQEADKQRAKGADEAKVKAALEKKLEKIAAAQQQSIADLHVLTDRIRHTRGIPEDAEGIGYRLGKTARNLNVVRLMGNMMLTSVADMAAIVMKHGFTAAFRDGFVPLVRDLKSWKLSAREAQDAGTALDLILHGRASALFDVMDEVRGGTMAERGLQFATNQMGAVTLMNRWNSGIKQMEGVITITKLSRQLEALSTAAPGSRQEAKALRYLGGLGIDRTYAKLMWKEFQRTGDNVNGLTLPNTQNWGRVSDAEIAVAEKKLFDAEEELKITRGQLKIAERRLRTAQLARDRAAPGAKPETIESLDTAIATAQAELVPLREASQKEAEKVSKAGVEAQGLTTSANVADDLRRVFRGAVARAVDDTIVTPGGERPAWMDGSEMGRIIAQFRSFTFSSTQKILYAGAQDLRAGELAPLGGLVFSVALGALSYYTIQIAKGGEAAEKVQNADWEKFLIEGIKRSLVLGVLAEAQSFAEDVPGKASEIASLGTGPSKRNPFAGPVTNLFGPTVGLLRDVDSVVSGALSGDMKDQDINSLRRLMPYNNVFWASRAFNAVADGAKQ